jgi:hypothetical protein
MAPEIGLGHQVGPSERTVTLGMLPCIHVQLGTSAPSGLPVLVPMEKPASPFLLPNALLDLLLTHQIGEKFALHLGSEGPKPEQVFFGPD